MKPLDSIRAAIVILVGVVHLGTGPARAQAPADGSADEPARHARTTVVLGILGLPAEALRGSLVGLLRAELTAVSLSLVERPPSREVAAWAGDAIRSDDTLLAILLDARSDQGWRVVVIDAARGRAIVRDLPGGIEQDAASIEAVVSIAVSAASALREGLEVASSPLEAVVGGSPSQAKSSNPTVRAHAQRSEESSERPAPSFLRGSIGISSASFSPQAVATHGLAFALGLHWRAQLEARLFGTLFWPATIRTDWGEFEVQRALLGGAAGPVLQLGKLSLIPEAGVVAERLRRSETTPAAGVLATQSKPLYRVGAVLALRLRVPLFRPLSAELAMGAAHFGRRAQFSTTGPAAPPLAEVWPAAAFAQLGLDIATR